MDLNIGVIGTGEIGADHVRRLSAHVAGARVQAVFDVDTARAAALAAEVGAVAHKNARDLIDDPEVEAVLIAAPSPVHAELTIECISARKQVFCEKPLAPSSEECLQVMEAETAAGARFVQVGFMRRYDEGYLRVKQAIDDGTLGDVLLAHCIHRNAQSPLGVPQRNAAHRFGDPRDRRRPLAPLRRAGGGTASSPGEGAPSPPTTFATHSS